MKETIQRGHFTVVVALDVVGTVVAVAGVEDASGALDIVAIKSTPEINELYQRFAKGSFEDNVTKLSLTST